MKVILLNGAPRSGKDTAARAILSTIRGSVLLRMSGPLKRGTHALFGLPVLHEDQFEDTKDIPSDDFHGLTPRQAYIRVSEQGVKPAFGEVFFGTVLADSVKRAEKSGASMVVVPDSGFAGEAGPVIAAYGAENVLLVRIHAPGRGCTFVNDSRSHIELPVRTVDITNDGDRDDFCFDIVGIASGFRE